MPINRSQILVTFYTRAVAYLTANQPKWSLSWYDQLPKSPLDVSESKLVAEYLWCVLASGFRASVVSSKWPKLTAITDNFQLSVALTKENELLEVWKNKRKIRGFVKGLSLIERYGYRDFLLCVASDVTFLQKLPGIGPITMCHLARNLGVDLAKPDLWLCRVSEWYFNEPLGSSLSWTYDRKFGDAQTICKIISINTGERVGKVDGILWCYCSTVGLDRALEEFCSITDELDHISRNTANDTQA